MSEVIQARRYHAKLTGAEGAHRTIALAVGRGDLPKVDQCTCADCGQPATAYDHRDYGLPMSVVPVCNSCNAKRGPALVNAATVERYRQAAIEYERGWKARMPEPSFVSLQIIGECESFRHAVRVSWEMRTIQNMTRASLAERIGAYAAHVTDYLCADDAKSRRCLPAERIDDFEWAMGNRVVTQYLLYKAGIAVELA